MRWINTIPTPAAIRTRSATWSSNAIYATFLMTPSRKAARPGWRSLPPIRRRAWSSTSRAAPKAPDATENPMSSGRGRSQRGFTYLVAMFAVAIAGLLLSVTSEVSSHSRQREKEKELLYVGGQFREAIALYYQRTPGAVKRYPEKVHADPMTGKSQWGTIAAPGGGIMGVYSLSDQRPIKSANFDTRDETFAGGQRYSDWKFLYEPPVSSAGDQSSPLNSSNLKGP